MRRLVCVLVAAGGLSSGGAAAADVTPGAPLRATVLEMTIGGTTTRTVAQVRSAVIDRRRNPPTEPGADRFAQPQIAAPRLQVVVAFPPSSMPLPLVQAFFDGTAVDGAVDLYFGANPAQSGRRACSFDDAVVTEVTLPALDAGSSAEGFVLVAFKAAAFRRGGTAGSLPAGWATSTRFFLNNFRFTGSGDPDATAIVSVEPIVFRQRVARGPIESPTVAVWVSEQGTGAATFDTWFDAGRERPATLELLSQSQRALLTIDFQSVEPIAAHQVPNDQRMRRFDVHVGHFGVRR